MRGEPTFGAVIPYYHGEEFWPELAESLRRQTRPLDRAVVVIDGPGQDLPGAGTEGLAREVHLVRHRENRGVAEARNSGLESVGTDYVFFLDQDDFWGHGALAFAELFSGNHERAMNAINRAVELNPNSADSHAMRGTILNFVGNPTEALEEVGLAIRLNPGHPAWYLVGLGRAYYLLGQYDDAIPYLERLVNAGEEILTWSALLTASYMGAGRENEARAGAQALLAAHPDASCTQILAITPYRDEQGASHYREMLRLAGIPE